MKLATVSTIVSAVLLSCVAANSFAASSNQDKHPCPRGQIAVLEQGKWDCKELGFKARGSQQTNSKPAAASAKIIAAPKADFVILSATKTGGETNKFAVKIKNQGAANTSGGQLQGLNYGTSGGGATSPMPKFNAGETKIVYLTFNTSEFNRKDRVMFIADSTNSVPETNENNNKYAINY